jgi:hypothetical protein
LRQEAARAKLLMGKPAEDRDTVQVLDGVNHDCPSIRDCDDAGRRGDDTGRERIEDAASWSAGRVRKCGHMRGGQARGRLQGDAKGGVPPPLRGRVPQPIPRGDACSAPPKTPPAGLNGRPASRARLLRGWASGERVENEGWGWVMRCPAFGWRRRLWGRLSQRRSP